MMQWHGHKDGKANERFGYGERLYLYHPDTGESRFIGWNCGSFGGKGLYLVQPKNTVNELILYDGNYLKNRRELEAAGKGLKRF